MSLQRGKKLSIRENIISTVNGPRNGRKVWIERQILILITWLWLCWHDSSLGIGLHTYIYQSSLSQLPYGDEEGTSWMALGVMQYFMLWKLGMWIDAWVCVGSYHQPRDVGRCRDSDIRVVRSLERLSIQSLIVTTRMIKDETARSQNLKLVFSLGYARMIVRLIYRRLYSIFALAPENSPPGPEFGQLTHEQHCILDLIKYADNRSLSE